jgi:hypothetical protein
LGRGSDRVAEIMQRVEEADQAVAVVGVICRPGHQNRGVTVAAADVRHGDTPLELIDDPIQRRQPLRHEAHLVAITVEGGDAAVQATAVVTPGNPLPGPEGLGGLRIQPLPHIAFRAACTAGELVRAAGPGDDACEAPPFGGDEPGREMPVVYGASARSPMIIVSMKGASRQDSSLVTASVAPARMPVANWIAPGVRSR